MKRIPSLQGLSRDHHHDLVYASQLVRWAASPDPTPELWARTGEILEDLPSHFSFEEQCVLPWVANTKGGRALVGQAREDHHTLIALFSELGAQLKLNSPQRPLGETLRELVRTLAHALRRHVRFEEQTLFPAVQLVLDENQSDALGRAWALHSARRSHVENQLTLTECAHA